MYLYTCIFELMHLYTYTPIYPSSPYKYIRTCIYTHIHIYTYSHAHTYAYTHIHIYTYTYTFFTH